MKAITIQLTKNCMLKCPYCFAGEKSNEFISDDVLESVKQFVYKNQIPLIRITGGEPFLYSQCVDVINYFSKRCIDLKVFSNLCVPHCFEGIAYPHKVIVLANINNHEFYSEEQIKIIESNLSCAVKMGLRIIIGRTFYEPPYQIDDLVELAKKYGVSTLRVSPANPTINSNNHFMKSDQISTLMIYLMKKQIELDSVGIVIRFDCPIPPCIVNTDAYSFFYNRKQLNNKCGKRLVVCIDGSVEHCYVTSSIIKLHINQFDTYDQMAFCMENELNNYSFNCVDTSNCIGCSYFNTSTPCGCYGFHKHLNEIQRKARGENK